MLTPSSWTNRVEWPTQVTVTAPRLAWMVPRSLATWGRFAVRGEKVAAHIRETKKVTRVQAPTVGCD